MNIYLAKSDKIACYHCGEDCGRHPIEYDDKHFCCSGCKAVYEILSDNAACEYYSIENNPGIKNIQTEIGNKFAYLDNEEILSEILDFSDGGINKVKFFIPNIHCSSCIWLLENLHRFNKGILVSNVNFVKKEVQFTYKSEFISLRQLVELLASINYTPQITLDDLKAGDQPKTDKKIYYKLGVAGFCFGNIMLLSFPEYLNFNKTLEEEYRTAFAYINLVLILPVVFYAATDYFLSAFASLRKKVINIDLPISIGIVVLFIRSLVEVVTAADVGYLDSLAGLVFFLLIGKWYQNKTYQALSFERNYKSYFPVAVNTIDDDGIESAIPLKQLKTGQRIIVRNQELIPADAYLMKGQASIDYSFVSGESTPVAKKEKDLIYAGGRQMGSAIELVVAKEVAQSYLTELWNQDINTEKKESRLNSIVNTVSHYFTATIILISILSAAYWFIFNPDNVMNAFTSGLIIACPCALALTLPFAFGSAVRIYGRAGFYLKKPDIVERLSKIDTIVFDKTGTLTKNDEFQIDDSELILNSNELVLVKSAVKHSTHPLSVAIYQFIKSELEELDSFEEIPAAGISAFIDDQKIKIGSQSFVTGESKESGVYSSRVYISINDDFKGYYIIKNAYREGVEEIIGSLNKNYDLHLLSGDNESERQYFNQLLAKNDQIRFNQSPKDKLEYVRSLKENGRHVLMIGDGLNDAGALSESEIGISIAYNIYHFSPACDAILEASKFKDLVKFIQLSKKSMNIIKMSFIISFLYNIVGLIFAVQAFLTPVLSAILMPISSVTVVAFITIASLYNARRSNLDLKIS
ncbi:MAG: heavy metal translocating P-type ATPase [Bacteroidetes bacterium]|nr:heavy metal translocating P-type ATPase [Bacteroidota bacterium]